MNLYRIITVFIFILAIFLLGDKLDFVSDRISFKNQSSICPGCNVIIVGYDTVGASHVSGLGYFRQTTPTLDDIAKEGFLFTQNISPSSWTVPSFMSVFTGLYPTEHRVVNKFTVFNKEKKVLSNLKQLSPKTQTLAEFLKKQGYVTAGFTGDAGVSGQFGYKQGFDIYTDEQKFGSIGNSADHAISWLKKNKDKKFFMFLHGYDAHGQSDLPQEDGIFVPRDYKGPFTGTPKDEEILREAQLIQEINMTPADVAFWNGLYDSKIRRGDDKFLAFWSKFKKLGLDKNTIIIMLSDHGEEFFEHRGIDHGHTIYGELVHVPLVFKVPGMSGNVKITQQTTSLDIVPTLLDILGIKPDSKFSSQFRGFSLLPAMEGQEIGDRDIFTETDYRDFTHKRAIRSADGWEYILTMQTGVAELYNLKIDPGEKNNLVSSNPAKASELDKKLRDHVISMGDIPDKKWTVGCLPVYVGECE